jgi:hypothetical protein
MSGAVILGGQLDKQAELAQNRSLQLADPSGFLIPDGVPVIRTRYYRGEFRDGQLMDQQTRRPQPYMAKSPGGNGLALHLMTRNEPDSSSYSGGRCQDLGRDAFLPFARVIRHGVRFGYHPHYDADGFRALQFWHDIDGADARRRTPVLRFEKYNNTDGVVSRMRVQSAASAGDTSTYVDIPGQNLAVPQIVGVNEGKGNLWVIEWDYDLIADKYLGVRWGPYLAGSFLPDDGSVLAPNGANKAASVAAFAALAGPGSSTLTTFRYGLNLGIKEIINRNDGGPWGQHHQLRLGAVALRRELLVAHVDVGGRGIRRGDRMTLKKLSDTASVEASIVEYLQAHGPTSFDDLADALISGKSRLLTGFHANGEREGGEREVDWLDHAIVESMQIGSNPDGEGEGGPIIFLKGEQS